MGTTDFAAQCEWLARRFKVVDLPTAVPLLDRRGQLPGRVVTLTFDDGFADNFDSALPALRRTGLTGAVFVVAATLDRGHPVDWVDDPPEFQLETLTRSQIETMSDEGIHIGSHSLFHTDLTTLDYDECLQDLATSKAILEEIVHRPVPYLAYPRGRWNDVVASAAVAAGYLGAFSLPTGPEPIGPFSLPRVGIYRENGPLQFKVKNLRAYQLARTSRLYGAVRG
jgi:peptidoglycan/xylan/chitin deacetylase (PgdA/CDA1 family)